MLVEILKKYNLVPKNGDLEDILVREGNMNMYDIIKKDARAVKELDKAMSKYDNDPVRKRMFHMIYDNDFLPVNCLSWIEDNNQYIYTYNKLHIVDNKEISGELIKHVKRIIRWIAGVAGKSPDIEVWIFLCPFKKKLPSQKGKPLGRNEVNSGVTLLSGSSSWIQVYRREEVLKVLIHELLHYYQLDIRDAAEALQTKLGIDHLLNEAYNELFAIYCHTLYYANYKGLDFKECFDEEVKHSKQMFHKIIDYYGIKEWSDFFSPDFVQYSNVFSYYILKYLLMGYTSILDTPKRRDISNITGVLKGIIDKHQLRIKKDVSHDDSLRMSVLELL